MEDIVSLLDAEFVLVTLEDIDGDDDIVAEGADDRDDEGVAELHADELSDLYAVCVGRFEAEVLPHLETVLVVLSETDCVCLLVSDQDEERELTSVRDCFGVNVKVPVVELEALKWLAVIDGEPDIECEELPLDVGECVDVSEPVMGLGLEEAEPESEPVMGLALMDADPESETVAGLGEKDADSDPDPL